ncbi:hypothetical protein FJNA_07270 [Thermus sp. FJN-A]
MGAKALAVKSVLPPGDQGTMRVMGLEGYRWAQVDPKNIAPRLAPSHLVNFRLSLRILLPPFLVELAYHLKAFASTAPFWVMGSPGGKLHPWLLGVYARTVSGGGL